MLTQPVRVSNHQTFFLFNIPLKSNRRSARGGLGGGAVEGEQSAPQRHEIRFLFDSRLSHSNSSINCSDKGALHSFV